MKSIAAIHELMDRITPPLIKWSKRRVTGRQTIAKSFSVDQLLVRLRKGFLGTEYYDYQHLLLFHFFILLIATTSCYCPCCRVLNIPSEQEA